MVTVTNTNPPTPPSGWGDDNWTFAIVTGNASLAAAVAQEGDDDYFNFFVTIAPVQISYNVNPFSNSSNGGGKIAVPPRSRLV